MLSFDSYHCSTQQSGFTLIELMISACIIGILGAIALPMYQGYTTKAKLSEVILAATACRLSVIDVVQSPSSNLAIVLPKACESIHTKYVKNITVSANGIITVHANETQLFSLTNSTNILTLAPIQRGSNLQVGIRDANEAIVSWRCGSVIDGTTIPSRYLPKSCEGNN